MYNCGPAAVAGAPDIRPHRRPARTLRPPGTRSPRAAIARRTHFEDRRHVRDQVPAVSRSRRQTRPEETAQSSPRTRTNSLKMYKMMSFVRVFDTKAIALQRTGQLGTYASCLGHEATHVGIGAAMQPEDAFFPMYREYGAQFWRGVKPHEVLLFWGGDERGNNFSGPAARFRLVRAHRDPMSPRHRRSHGIQVAQGKARRGEPLSATAAPRKAITMNPSMPPAPGSCRWCIVMSNNKWAISVPLSAQTGLRDPGAESHRGRHRRYPGGRQRHHRRA